MFFDGRQEKRYPEATKKGVVPVAARWLLLINISEGLIGVDGAKNPLINGAGR